MDSDTEYFDAIETVDVDTDDDVPYFQQGAEPPPREQWEIAEPIDFLNVQAVTQLSHQLDQLFLSQKEIETPLSMDDLKQWWKWDDVGSCRMPRAPTTYPALMIDEGNGIQRPAASQVTSQNALPVDHRQSLMVTRVCHCFMCMWTIASCQALILQPIGHSLHPGSKADVQ